MSMVEAAIRAGVTKGVSLLAGVNRKRMDTSSPHPFLSGIHEPVTAERSLADLQVTGEIPAGLDGRYLRIGPNPVGPEFGGHHWFVGDGMVHGLALSRGRALWYRNRWIRSKAVSQALGEAPAPGVRREQSDTVNTNVVSIGGRTWALVEAGAYPVELGETLQAQTHNPFDGTLSGSFSAHPHRDPLTGEHHAIAYDATAPDVVRHVVLSPNAKVVRELAVPVKNGPSIHDCAFTSRYVLILDLSVTLSIKAVIGGHQFPYRWNPSHQARVGLLPRTGAAEDVIWCDLEPCYVFHTVNAYDAQDGCVVLDVVAYDTMFADSMQGPDAVGRLERWTIDPRSRKVDRAVLDADPQEFPRTDERLLGQPHRYVYASAVARGADTWGVETRLYKNDVVSGERQVHDFGSGRHPGEFVFTPASPDAAEDEGWLIGLVIDMGRATTDLVILNAQAFEADPVASIRIPYRIPAGFHGNWLAA